RAEARSGKNKAISDVSDDPHRGPKGRNEIATSVRAWFSRPGSFLKHRRCNIYRGYAAAQCSEALPHRRPLLNSDCVEAQPRRRELDSSTVSQRLTALAGGRAVLAILLLLTTHCLLLTPSPSPTPAPSPSPLPTPPPNLHQWGAVTSFHGLPSDRTHAIAQTEFGVTWFATDGGLARYDGRRTNAINADGLPTGRVLVLKTDDSGALWIGTDNGAARMWNGKF